MDALLETSQMAYATPADLRARFDERTISELVSDDGSAVALGDLNTDTNVLAALDDASGMVEAALLFAGRYTTEQLGALTGNSLALLKRIVCHLAAGLLENRRFDFDPDRYDRMTSWANEQLEKLRSGANLFDLDDNIEATKASLETPSLAQRAEPGLVRDRTRNYYPGVNLPAMN